MTPDAIRTATVIRPGDHVLLTTIEPFEQDFSSMMDQLRARFPGVEFTIVAGVTDIAVRRRTLTHGCLTGRHEVCSGADAEPPCDCHCHGIDKLSRIG